MLNARISPLFRLFVLAQIEKNNNNKVPKGSHDVLLHEANVKLIIECSWLARKKATYNASF